jgi:peptidyl-prolyl cis-trans isomerase B (cyclophilin B)
MANAGPNTNGSQFFFTWQNTTLAPGYTPFGTVIGGMDVLPRRSVPEPLHGLPGSAGHPNVAVSMSPREPAWLS